MSASKRSNSFDRISGIYEPLYDMARRLVPVERLVWRVPSVSGGRLKSLNWGRFPQIPRYIAEAIVAYMRHSVATKSPDHCLGTFNSLVQFAETMVTQSDHHEMRTLLLLHLARIRGIAQEWRYHYVRDWYRWCFDQNISGLDEPELLYECGLAPNSRQPQGRSRCFPKTRTMVRWTRSKKLRYALPFNAIATHLWSAR